MDVMGYAPVNGLRLYYEIHGTGEPLILLHGGVGGIHMFGGNVAALAASRRVIAVELQGHGRTVDIDRPLRYEAMADDVAGLAQHLGLERTDVLGYSLGAGVALQMAFRHPQAVRRLVAVSIPVRHAGWYPEVLASFAQMGPETAIHMSHSPLARLYPGVRWPDLFGKLGALQRQDYDWSADAAAMRVPTMLVFADADAVSTAHVAEFYGLLGGGRRDAGLDGSARPTARLAIVPGRTHYDICAAPELAALVAGFLDADRVEAAPPHGGA